MKSDRVAVENVNHPGQITHLDAAKYADMKRAILEILPDASPGFSFADIRERLPGHLSEEFFPGGATAAWWLKTVQLDLEAKGIIHREEGRPLRWRRGGGGVRS